MEELENLSVKSFLSSNSIDSESTGNKLINKKLNEQLKSIDVNLIDDESNKSTNLKNEKKKLIDNLLNEDKWKLKLNWNFRVELIKLLDDYTRLLINNEDLSIDEKELIEKNKNDLFKLLTKTPLKLDEESNSYKIFINLDNVFKHQIIDQLIKNENLIIDYRDELDTNLIDELIEENNHLITKIINLPVQYFCQLESKDEKLVNKLKREFSNLQNETIDLKEVIDKLTIKLDDEKLDNQKFKDQLNNDTIVHEEEISKLKSKLDDEIFINENLMNQLNQNNSNKLNCVLKDMKKFFENDNQFSSEEITFLNVNWFIDIRSRHDSADNRKYLEFYLQAKNEIDDMNVLKWKCTISYDLIIKNNLPDKEDKIMKFNYTFSKYEGHGYPKFITDEELFNLENGYMLDDSIKLEVNLKVDKIERNI